MRQNRIFRFNDAKTRHRLNTVNVGFIAWGGLEHKGEDCGAQVETEGSTWGAEIGANTGGVLECRGVLG